jgi:AcrR family transcriptional regulator
MSVTARARRNDLPDRLADRLVVVAEELLESDGLEHLSLREVARRAGVTHGAPLRHYASFATLLSEVAARGFDNLIAAVDARAAAIPAGAGAHVRLAACAHAYVRCAVSRPHVFALMFHPESLDRTHERLIARSRASFEQLLYYVRAAQDAGWHSGEDTRRLAGVLWALVHGLAMLWSQQAMPAVVADASLDDMLSTAIDLMLGGTSFGKLRETNPSSRRRGSIRRGQER